MNAIATLRQSVSASLQLIGPSVDIHREIEHPQKTVRLLYDASPGLGSAALPGLVRDYNGLAMLMRAIELACSIYTVLQLVIVDE